MSQNGNEKLNEVKYEALAQVITQGQEEQSRKWKDFKEYFEEFRLNLKEDIGELKAYNKVQNGRMVDTMEKVRVLEDQSLQHETNCPLVSRVASLEKDNDKNKNIRGWLIKAVTIAISILGGAWIIIQMAKAIWPFIEKITGK